jgi:2-dehydropantoate 2-reductase
MKVCIYGAGAIGGWIGVHLAQTGHEISVVARGATLTALQQHGLQCVQSQAADAKLVASVKASANPEDLGPQDLVIVAVKAPAMADVAKGIAPLLGPHTVVMTAMNGVPWWFFQGFGGALENTSLSPSIRAASLPKPYPRTMWWAVWFMPAAHWMHRVWCDITLGKV